MHTTYILNMHSKREPCPSTKHYQISWCPLIIIIDYNGRKLDNFPDVNIDITPRKYQIYIHESHRNSKRIRPKGDTSWIRTNDLMRLIRPVML